MMPNRWSFTLACTALVASLAAAACSGGEAVSATTPPSGRGGGGGQNAPVPVTVATAVQKAMPITIQGIGTVIAASTGSVRAQITGEVTAVTVQESGGV